MDDLTGFNYLSASRPVSISRGMRIVGFSDRRTSTVKYNNSGFFKKSIVDSAASVHTVVDNNVEICAYIRPIFNLNRDQYLMLHAGILSIMYRQRSEEDYELSRFDVFSAYASFIASYTRDLDPRDWEKFTRPCNIILKPITVKNKDQLYDAIQKLFPSTNGFLTEANEARVLSSEHLGAMLSVMFQTMGHRQQKAGFEKWYKNRYRSALNTLGGKPVNEEWLKKPPTLATLEALNQNMSSAFAFRRKVFLCLRTIARELNSNTKKMINHTLSMLAWSEAAYVLMIDEYLVGVMPELFTVKWMRGEEYTVADMVAFMNDMGDDKCYVKFLLPPEECMVIHRSVLRRSIIAAALIAKKVEPSFKNYIVPNADSEFAMNISKIIDDWFRERQNLDP